MRDLIESLLRELVDHPEDLFVEEVRGEASIVFEVEVHPEDRGRVIGHRGAVINSFRTLLNAKGGREGVRYYLSLLDDPANA